MNCAVPLYQIYDNMMRFRNHQEQRLSICVYIVNMNDSDPALQRDEVEFRQGREMLLRKSERKSINWDIYWKLENV